MLRDRQAGRQTDVTKLIVAFRDFANVPGHIMSFVICVLYVSYL
jgi:hypothetical protein